jgi:D-3-phosphoglycerate dehydrogenase
MHGEIISRLQDLGLEVDYLPQINRSELLDIIHQYQGLIIRSKTRVDAPLIARAGNLKFVARAGAGLDNLDMDELSRAQVAVLNAAEANRDALAEHTLGMLLSLLHKLNAGDRSVREGNWDREGHRGEELQHQTVGLIGYGNMGSAVTQRLRAFNCKVLAYDKYKSSFDSDFASSVDLEELFKCCNILSLHVPLTSETRGFYDYSFFQRFEHPIILINTARGEILPLPDLVRNLKEGRIKAAGLDVLESEPISELAEKQLDTYNYLVNSPQVILTPHVAGWSTQSYLKISQTLAHKIIDLRQRGVID